MAVGLVGVRYRSMVFHDGPDEMLAGWLRSLPVFTMTIIVKDPSES